MFKSISIFKISLILKSIIEERIRKILILGDIGYIVKFGLFCGIKQEIYTSKKKKFVVMAMAAIVNLYNSL